jgi:hypothetical protein
MMDWLGQLVGLPSKFLYSSGGTGVGVIQVLDALIEWGCSGAGCVN